MLRRRTAVIAIVLVLLTPTSTAQGVSSTESVHASGIELVGLDVMQARPADEKQAMAFNVVLQFAMDHPDDFGYPWIDPATGTIEISSASEKGARLAPSLALALGDNLNRTRQVEFSYSQLQKIRDEITHIRGSGLDGEDVLFTIEPDQQLNRVIVTIDRMHDGLLNELASRFGTTAVAVRVDPDVPKVVGPGRHNDFSPFWGGSQINTPTGSCSSGFPWANGTLWDGIVTAAHCVPNGGSVSTPAEAMGSVTSGYRENWQAGNGTVPYTGESINRGDAAVVQIYPGLASGAFIYRGGAGSETSSIVRLVWARWSNNGDVNCLGGFKGGEVCGYQVTAVGIDQWYSETGEWAREVVRSSKNASTGCHQKGDSGGSVFTTYQDGVAAKGIFSGGGNVLGTCYMYYTDIQHPVQALPGGVKWLACC